MFLRWHAFFGGGGGGGGGEGALSFDSQVSVCICTHNTRAHVVSLVPTPPNLHLIPVCLSHARDNGRTFLQSRHSTGLIGDEVIVVDLKALAHTTHVVAPSPFTALQIWSHCSFSKLYRTGGGGGVENWMD